MTQEVKEAIGYLHKAFTFVSTDKDLPWLKKWRAEDCLLHAVRYLSRPDRAIYPKTRKGTKSRPVRIVCA